MLEGLYLFWKDVELKGIFGYKFDIKIVIVRKTMPLGDKSFFQIILE